MTAPRFFCPIPLPTGETIELPDEIAHHIRVLRLIADSTVILFNGQGGEVTATLRFEGKRAFAVLHTHQAREAELKGHLTLWQGLPTSDKMDWIVEKCVEIGVSRIVPIAAQRSVLQLSGPRLDKRVQHWRKIAISAAEQCGRNRLMQIDYPVPLQEAIRTAGHDALRLFCDPAAERPLHEILRDQPCIEALTLMVGPEGGWSDTETRNAIASNAIAIRYGPRVLRTETAGIALASAVSALLNW